MNENTFILLVAICAAVPLVMFLVNLALYRRSPRPSTASISHSSNIPDSKIEVSVLVPARNEEATMDRLLASLSAQEGRHVEFVVLDDHSTDRTAEIVQQWQKKDPRIRLIRGRPLLSGWCGKPYACHQLGQHARGNWLVFIDADVTLHKDALRRMVGLAESSGTDLLSGVPHQQTLSFLEKLLIPLIHFVLLGFLPMAGMRRSRSEKYAAGCGQLFVAKKHSYHLMGGHAPLRRTLHDGLELPRLFRRAGLKTDLFDPTDVATCRMYLDNRSTWVGLGKNATEGMASPRRILPFTFLLGMGQVVPWILLGLSWGSLEFWGGVVWASAISGVLVRAISAVRFRQSWLGVAFHPLGVILLLLIQWQALIRMWRGRPMEWKGRKYAHAAHAN